MIFVKIQFHCEMIKWIEIKIILTTDNEKIPYKQPVVIK